MIDARDLAIVSSGGVDTFYVSDGYDSRSSNDHPIYVYTLSSAPAPTAAFAAIPTTGRAPYTVQFTDQSTPASPALGAPTSWAWDFDGNGTTDSTLQNPTFQYTVAGTYTVKLTATNAAGSTSVTHSIVVKPTSALPGGYTLDGFGGLHPFRGRHGHPARHADRWSVLERLGHRPWPRGLGERPERLRARRLRRSALVPHRWRCEPRGRQRRCVLERLGHRTRDRPACPTATVATSSTPSAAPTRSPSVTTRSRRT